jgi:hypothetical protein
MPVQNWLQAHGSACTGIPTPAGPDPAAFGGGGLDTSGARRRQVNGVGLGTYVVAVHHDADVVVDRATPAHRPDCAVGGGLCGSGEETRTRWERPGTVGG